MEPSDIAWTIGACIIGGVAGPIFQKLITKDRPTVDNRSGIVVGDVIIDESRIDVKVRTQTVLNIVSAPRDRPAPKTRAVSNTPTDDNAIWGYLIGMFVVAVIVATLYAKYEDTIILVLIIIAGFSAFFLLTSLIYLITRGVSFEPSLVIQLTFLVLLLVATGFSIKFLSNPPAFESSVGTYDQMVAVFRESGTNGLNNGYDINAVFFLLYQCLGALLTAVLTGWVIWTAAKIIAITDLAVGARQTRFRVFLVTAGPKPGGMVITGVFIACVAVILSSGLGYKWIQEWNSTNLNNLVPSTSTTSPTASSGAKVPAASSPNVGAETGATPAPESPTS